MKQEDKKFWQGWGAVVAVGGLLLTLFTGNPAPLVFALVAGLALSLWMS